MPSIRNYFESVFGVDKRSLPIFRIGLGLVGLYWFLDKLFHLTDYYGSGSLIEPNNLRLDGIYSVSLLIDSAWWQYLLCSLGIIASVSLIIGLFSKVSNFLLLIIFTGFIKSNPYIAHSGETLYGVLLTWSLFLPLARNFSLDTLFLKNEEKASGEKKLWNIATTGLTLQIFLVYFINFLLKGEHWKDTMMAGSMSLNLHYLSTRLGDWLAQSQFDALQPLIRIGTFTWASLELILPLLLLVTFARGWLRFWGLAVMAVFHIGFSSLLSLGVFSWVIVVAYIPLVPTVVWDRLLTPIKQLKIYYDSKCAFCTAVTCSLGSMYKTDTIYSDSEIEQLSDSYDSMVVDTLDGKRHFNLGAVLAVAGNYPLLKPLVPILRLPPIYWLGNNVYGLVSHSRYRISQMVDKQESKLTNNILFDAVRFSFVILTFVVMLLGSYYTLSNGDKWGKIATPQISAALDDINTWQYNIGYMEQRWSMFAANPPGATNIYTIDVTRDDGTSYDLLTDRDDQELNERRATGKYAQDEWGKYLTDYASQANFAEHLMVYACNQDPSAQSIDYKVYNSEIRYYNDTRIIYRETPTLTAEYNWVCN